MELVLLKEGISLTEQEKMDKRKKWLYYYYILEGKRKEREESEKAYKESRDLKAKKSKKTPFDFKVEHKKIREFIEKENELHKEIGSDPK